MEKVQKLKLLENKERFEIFVEGGRGCWRACFRIDQQSFHVCERDTKKEAQWFAKCLRHAFKKVGFVHLKNPDLRERN